MNYRLQFRTSFQNVDGEVRNLLEQVAREAAEAAAATLVGSDVLGAGDVSVEYEVVLNDRTIPSVSRHGVDRVTNFRERPSEVTEEDSPTETIPMETITDFQPSLTADEREAEAEAAEAERDERDDQVEHTHDEDGQARGAGGRFVRHDDSHE